MTEEYDEDASRPNALALRLAGIGWFLFIPLVLYLYLAYPFGIFASVIPGIVIMVAHGRFARPFMDRHKAYRCFWTGDFVPRGESLPLTISTPKGGIDFVVRDDDAALRTRRLITFANRRRPFLAVGIFAPVIVYLVGILLVGAEASFLPEGAEAGLHYLFKGVIALTVVTTAIAYRFQAPAEELPVFRMPIHNLTLMGARYTLAVFFGVGVVWLYQTAVALFF